MTLYSKDGNTILQRYAWKLFLINYVLKYQCFYFFIYLFSFAVSLREWLGHSIRSNGENLNMGIFHILKQIKVLRVLFSIRHCQLCRQEGRLKLRLLSRYCLIYWLFRIQYIFWWLGVCSSTFMQVIVNRLLSAV